MLTNLIMVNINNIYMHQITTLYILNLMLYVNYRSIEVGKCESTNIEFFHAETKLLKTLIALNYYIFSALTFLGEC